jgi:hypothetical protein
MKQRSLGIIGALIASATAFVGAAAASLTFEELIPMSDRIVLATVKSAVGGSVRLPNGRDVPLGAKDPASGIVFTAYRIAITECLLDVDDACLPGESEVSVTGGNVYETVDGRERLRTWEIGGAAGVPMPRAGDELLLILVKRNGRYVPVNDPGARVPVNRSSGPPSVHLSFGSPRFLSAAGLESVRSQAGAAPPSTARPLFSENVPIGELRRLVALARPVPKPTSEIPHAIPSCAIAHDAGALLQRRACVRAGKDTERRESPLGLGTDCDSFDRCGDDRRSLGS